MELDFRSVNPQACRTYLLKGRGSSEAVLVDPWDRLPELGCLVLVLYGGRLNDALLSAAHAQRYSEKLALGEVICWPDARHDVREPDRARFIAALRVFLHRVDSR